MSSRNRSSSLSTAEATACCGNCAAACSLGLLAPSISEAGSSDTVVLSEPVCCSSEVARQSDTAEAEGAPSKSSHATMLQRFWLRCCTPVQQRQCSHFRTAVHSVRGCICHIGGAFCQLGKTMPCYSRPRLASFTHLRLSCCAAPIGRCASGLPLHVAWGSGIPQPSGTPHSIVPLKKAQAQCQVPSSLAPCSGA